MVGRVLDLFRTMGPCTHSDWLLCVRIFLGRSTNACTPARCRRSFTFSLCCRWCTSSHVINVCGPGNTHPARRDSPKPKEIYFHSTGNPSGLFTTCPSVCIPFGFLFHAVDTWSIVGLFFTGLCDDSLGTLAFLCTRIRRTFYLSNSG